MKFSGPAYSKLGTEKKILPSLHTCFTKGLGLEILIARKTYNSLNSNRFKISKVTWVRIAATKPKPSTAAPNP